ncbi:MAG: alanine--glyoxylate aminotransferase family protein [Acidobacteriota bacterium]
MDLNRPVTAKTPRRLLLGPGPSEVPSTVLQAMSQPLIGHLDPAFLRIMDEVQAMLRQVFQTANTVTLPLSGTGSAGMEAAVLNLVEPGDSVLVGVNGVFGSRIAEAVRRAGGRAETVEAPWGRALDPDDVRRRAKEVGPQVLAVVHAETSTGVLQDLAPLRSICDEVGALLLVDCVTSLGGHPVTADAWGVDVAYSGTQKCLSCPPGLAPFTAGARALEKRRRRRAPCPTWYLDWELLTAYWGGDRTYHHTAPVSLILALHEGLRLVLEEGLENRWRRHRQNHRALVAGLEALGLRMLVPPGERLWVLNAVIVPDGVDDIAARRTLLERYGIEIGGGLGELRGRIWRIGLMGAGSTFENVVRCLTALARVLSGAGHRGSLAAAVEAAEAALDAAEG